jgi:hypothetical protein
MLSKIFTRILNRPGDAARSQQHSRQRRGDQIGGFDDNNEGRTHAYDRVESSIHNVIQDGQGQQWLSPEWSQLEINEHYIPQVKKQLKPKITTLTTVSASTEESGEGEAEMIRSDSSSSSQKSSANLGATSN